MFVTPHFRLEEFTDSATAARHEREVVVDPGGPIYQNIERLCKEVLEPLRESLWPIEITSGYRPPWLNKAVGGSPVSQHLTGQAADVKVILGPKRFMDVGQVVARVYTLDLPVDQCINEFGKWAHLSVARAGKKPRRQFLKAVKRNGRVVFLPDEAAKAVSLR